MDTPVDDTALDQLFREARSHFSWLPRPMENSDLAAIYELAKWGPTASNSTPARFLFIRSPQGKKRLRPHLLPANVDKSMNAPCTVVIAWDTEFHEKMPQLFPSRDVRSIFVGKDDLIRETGTRSTVLQAGYFIMAARAMGFDCGPMSGFDREGVDREFLESRKWKSELLCNIGHGDPKRVFPRNPRLDFDQACDYA